MGVQKSRKSIKYTKYSLKKLKECYTSAHLNNNTKRQFIYNKYGIHNTRIFSITDLRNRSNNFFSVK